MEDLYLTIVQTELIWEDIEANLDMIEKKIDFADQISDIIVLPEMFLTGFSMNPKKLYLTMDHPIISRLKNKSAEKQADIVGSLIIKEDGKYFNRLLWFTKDKKMFYYDKKHLFRVADEHKHYSCGDNRITVVSKGFNIRPFICYDLRFPVWTRNRNNRFDIAIFVANWPAKRSHHWKMLLKARAIENQCYVIGVNRVGKDGNGLNYDGDSMAVNYNGDILFHKSSDNCIATVKLSMTELIKYRKEFPFYLDAD